MNPSKDLTFLLFLLSPLIPIALKNVIIPTEYVTFVDYKQFREPCHHFYFLYIELQQWYDLKFSVNI